MEGKQKSAITLTVAFGKEIHRRTETKKKIFHCNSSFRNIPLSYKYRNIETESITRYLTIWQSGGKSVKQETQPTNDPESLIPSPPRKILLAGFLRQSSSLSPLTANVDYGPRAT